MLESPEDFNRRVGSVELGPELVFRSRGEVIGRVAIALLLLAGFGAGVLAVAPLVPWPTALTAVVAIAAFAGYCAVGYFVRARPNHDQLGGPLGSPSA